MKAYASVLVSKIRVGLNMTRGLDQARQGIVWPAMGPLALPGSGARGSLGHGTCT